ncbi:MAG: hypothetical protein EBR58_09980, partial [Betaproteobacteria bacterium]|nr:hypothetical protein [Betaproteobacteria bacterium]
QLAIYAGATSYYDCATDTHTDPEPVDQDRALIVHLPAGGDTCTLHWLDIAAGREALEHAIWVRKWRNNKQLLTEVADEPSVSTTTEPKRKGSGKPRRTLEPVPMPPLPEATTKAAEGRTRPQKAAPVAKMTDDPDEGELVDLEILAELRARALSSPGEQLIRRWVAESQAANCDFNMGAGLHTERRYMISAAAVALAEGNDGDEWARAVLAAVIGDNAYDDATPVGQLLGQLTRNEAVDVDQLARTAVAHYDDNDRLIVERPDQ